MHRRLYKGSSEFTKRGGGIRHARTIHMVTHDTSLKAQPAVHTFRLFIWRWWYLRWEYLHSQKIKTHHKHGSPVPAPAVLQLKAQALGKTMPMGGHIRKISEKASSRSMIGMPGTRMEQSFYACCTPNIKLNLGVIVHGVIVCRVVFAGTVNSVSWKRTWYKQTWLIFKVQYCTIPHAKYRVHTSPDNERSFVTIWANDGWALARNLQ